MQVKKITDYVQKMFSKLPRTKEAIDIKQNILESMEDGYTEYVSQGFSEQEAYEKVVEKFGNIDEIKASLGVPQENYDEEDYGKDGFDEDDQTEAEPVIPKTRLQKAIVGVVMPLAVVIFLVAGIFGAWHPFWIVFPVFGVSCGVLSAVFDYYNCKREGTLDGKKKGLLIGSVCMLLTVIAYLLIGFLADGWHPWWVLFPVVSMCAGGFKLIVEIDDGEATQRKKISATSSVIMMLATSVFLILGAFFNLWHPAWIAFPIGGVLTSIVNIVFEAKKGE